METLPSYDELIKPTDEQMEQLPSYDELISQKTKTKEKTPLLQDVKDVIAGFGQGATLGFGDEISGAIQATGEVATGEPTLSDLGRLYRQYQKQKEAEYEEVKKRSPGLATTGEIVGGLIPAVFSGGTSGAASLGRMAVTGAKMGALAGLGGSKGTTEETISNIKQGKIPEMAKDVAFSGAIGGALPYAGSAAGKALSYGKEFVKDVISNTPVARQILAAFKEGTKGKSFIGSKATEMLDKEALEGASNIEQTVEKGRKFINGIYQKVLKTDVAFADNEKKMFSGAENLLKNAAGSVGESAESAIKSDLEKTVSTLKNIREGTTVEAQAIKDAQKYLRKIQNNSNLSFEAQQAFKQSSDNLNKILINKVPGYQDINQKFSKFEDAIETFVTGIPSESRSIMKGQKTEGSSLFKTAENVIEKSQLPFGMGNQQFKQLNMFKDELKNIQKNSPEILESMGIKNVDQYINGIKSAADIQSVARVIEKAGQLQQSISPLGYGYSGAYLSSNVAGRIANPFISGTKAATKALKLPEMSNYLYQATDDTLNGIVNKLNSSGYEHLGTALSNSMQNKSATAKNAVLFSIMQNPNVRKKIFGENNE
jgi:hypothetical protein